MVFRTIFGLISILFIVLSAQAEEIKLNPDHPDHYVVVKGDTLWDISGRFLQRPAQWPEIWQVNPQIQNPHLIFPGDKISLSYVDGKPQLSLSRGSSPSGEEKLFPRIHETKIDDAIPLIPYEKIAVFLSSPKIVGPHELENSPYIIGFSGEHLIAGAGDGIYVRAIEDPKTLSYIVYRAGETFVSPETKQILGYEAKYIANATLQESGDPATLTLIKSNEEVRMGDRIMPVSETEFIMNYFPKQPENDITGTIISVLNGVTQIGRYNVVAIDKGEKDGIAIGHVLDIFKRGDLVRDPYSPIRNDLVQLPNTVAGTLMVFRVFDQISYAIVLEASQAIHVLDKVQTP